MTEIARRACSHKGGPALLFEKPLHADGRASEMPALANLFGTVERVAMAVTLDGKQRSTASDLREVGELLAFLRQPEPPRGLKDALDLLPLAQECHGDAARRRCRARRARTSCWKATPSTSTACRSRRAGPATSPLITWPLVVTKGPGDAKEDDYNLGIYRMQKLGKNRTIMRWLKHRGGAQHYARWKKEKPAPLPAAAVIGADPGAILGAVTPVPDTLSEYQFAGLLRGRKVELVPCKTIPLKVPAEAEIVLEGHVMLDEYADEGPFGDHTGYYNSVEKFPVFQISAITMRRDPIYHDDLHGPSAG